MPRPLTLVGFVVIGLTLCAVVATAPGSSVMAFFDPLSVLWIFGMVTGGLLIGFPGETIRKAVGNCLGFGTAQNHEELLTHVSVCQRAYQLTWGAGFIGTLMGMVIMLGNLADPEAIGPAVAMALLTLLYAAVLAECIINPLQQNLISHSDESVLKSSERVDGGQRSLIERALAIVFLLIAMFFMVLVSFDW